MIRRNEKSTALLLLAGVLFSFALSGLADEFKNPKLQPPRAKPQRRTGGESVPPLPLPATPLRRSEKKRQPAPPAIVGMIRFDSGRMRLEGSSRVRVDDFPTTQVDIEPLMRELQSRLHLRYRYMETTFGSFSWDASELPVLYITGWTPLPDLPDETVAKLRRYLYDGGTLILHAQCGRREFTDSARRLIARILPNRQLTLLDSDSPIYASYYNITSAKIRKDDEPLRTLPVPPPLEAVYLGCRPAIMLSAWDLNCSWDVEKYPIVGGTLYHRDDGLKLGLNIITYVLANFQYARAWSVEKRYTQTNAPRRDSLTIAQVVHNGDWDPTPNALPNLLKYIQANTTLNVQFDRKTVPLDNIEIFDYPLLYMTGLRDFTLTDAEVDGLQKYLQRGGVLLADSAAGNAAFDHAFRREIKRVLPAAKFKTLPLDSPVYQMPYKITSVAYTPLVQAQNKGLAVPLLETISADEGQTSVIYSSLGLASGWEQLGY
ncbi:MAG TPA: DUF4159 domain-containing protein, partial [Phycisphaerae bacterium]|nr:DUF4159 domain-containing protein [Phycisphaerae bacterium]